MSERRKAKRFYAADNAFAVLHANSIIVTSLSDINMEGLAFEYMIDSDEHLGNAKELDIFCEDAEQMFDFHLQNVPFQIISQEEFGADDHFIPLVRKRFSVQFGELTAEQMARLDYFVNHLTTGEVPDTTAGIDTERMGAGLLDRMTFVF